MFIIMMLLNYSVCSYYYDFVKILIELRFLLFYRFEKEIYLWMEICLMCMGIKVYYLCKIKCEYFGIFINN